MNIDLKKEQKSSIERPKYRYSLVAKLFFWSMDFITGKKTTLAKVKLIEMLASIPYRSWEIRQYTRLTRFYRNQELVQKASSVMNWSRDAQDNEYLHLIVINEKMKEDNIKDPWYLNPLITYFIITFYIITTRIMAIFCIRQAFLFNAQFEDHAEHVYAEFVKANPQWDNQPVMNEKVKACVNYSNWGDVFRRIGLDERDHRNASFALCGKEDCIVEYDGMPNIGTL